MKLKATIGDMIKTKYGTMEIVDKKNGAVYLQLPENPCNVFNIPQKQINKFMNKKRKKVA
jgi:hypothetical protein